MTSCIDICGCLVWQSTIYSITLGKNHWVWRDVSLNTRGAVGGAAVGVYAEKVALGSHAQRARGDPGGEFEIEQFGFPFAFQYRTTANRPTTSSFRSKLHHHIS